MTQTQIRCNCTGELEDHHYVVENNTMRDGYLCLNCDDFKPMEDFEEDED